MKKRILIINGHPDASPERLCAGLAEAYAQGARTAGHDIRRLDPGNLAFPFLRTAQAFTEAPPHPDIVAAQNDFLWAEHFLFVFPLWLGGPPALLKGFMEWIGCHEFLLGQGKGMMPKGRLANRSARILVTMGMPAPVYRLFFRAHGVKAFDRGILRIAGIKPVRTSYIGGVGASADRSRRWIAAARGLGTKAL